MFAGFKKFGKVLTFTPGNNDTLGVGQGSLSKGAMMYALLAIFSITLNKSDAGTTTLSAADKRTLLGRFTVDMRYGHRLQRIPYPNVDAERVRREGLGQMDSEVLWYSDATVGLGKTIAASTDTTMKFGLLIPTGGRGRDPRKPHYRGMGPSQVKTVQLQISQSSSTAAVTGTTVTLKAATNTTVTLIPICTPEKFDRWSYIPELKERSEPNFEATLEDGMWLRVTENTAAHASSALTEIDQKIGDAVICEQSDPDDMYAVFDAENDAFGSTNSDLTGLETLLYQVPNGVPEDQIPTGPYNFRNQRQEITTNYKFRGVVIPVVSSEEIAADVEHVAKNIRRKSLVAISVPALERRAHALPTRLAPFQPFALVDFNDSEASSFAGLAASVTEGTRAEPSIPKALRDAAQARVAAYKAAGGVEAKAQEDVAKEIARQIPGAFASGAGAKGQRTTLTYERVRATVGAS